MQCRSLAWYIQKICTPTTSSSLPLQSSRETACEWCLQQASSSCRAQCSLLPGSLILRLDTTRCNSCPADHSHRYFSAGGNWRLEVEEHSWYEPSFSMFAELKKNFWNPRRGSSWIYPLSDTHSLMSIRSRCAEKGPALMRCVWMKKGNWNEEFIRRELQMIE